MPQPDRSPDCYAGPDKDRRVAGHRDAQQRERPDIAAGARMLEEILNDPAKRNGAALAGHQAWRERFTWRHIAEQYISAYKHLVAGEQR